MQNPQILNALPGHAGIYSLIIGVDGEFSEPTFTEVWVYEPPTASIVSSIDEICCGDSIQLTITATGDGPYTTLISGIETSPLTIEFSESMHNFWIHPTISTKCTLMSIANKGCSGTVTGLSDINIIVNPLPEINLYASGVEQVEKDFFICVYDTLSLVLNLPNTDLLWSDGTLHDTIHLWTSGISFDYRPMWVSATNKTTLCSITEEFNVFFTFTSCSYGLLDNEAENTFLLYPNPAGEFLNIRYRNPESGCDKIQLFDIFGRLMDEFTLPHSKEHELTINVSHLPKGIYLVKISNGNSLKIKKLVIGE